MINKDHFKHIGNQGILLYVCFVMVSCVLIYWSVERDPLIVEPVDGQPGYVKAKAGEYVNFSRKVCTSKSIMVTVDKNLYTVEEGTGTITTYPAEPTPVTHEFDPGCIVAGYKFKIPDEASPGEYVYQPFVEYNINPSNIKRKPIPPLIVRVVD